MSWLSEHFPLQLTNKTLSNSSQSELESRLHQLTETVIQKQTMIENLSTEKNSLVFQLERLEQQVHSASTGPSSGSSINMSGIDSGEGNTGKNMATKHNFEKLQKDHFYKEYSVMILLLCETWSLGC